MQKNALRKLFTLHKNDFILGAALLLAALCLFFIFRNTRHNGGIVQVKQDGKIVGEYPLSEDAEYEFKVYYGSNTLMIKDGYAYMAESDCKDHVCEKTGKISKTGESIICLPHELFITIIDGKDNDYDAVVN